MYSHICYYLIVQLHFSLQYSTEDITVIVVNLNHKLFNRITENYYY